jgi:hypothetical protein
MEEGRILHPSFVHGQEGPLDLHARFPEGPCASTRFRPRVLSSIYHARDSGIPQGHGARWRLPEVVAGLQAYVGGGSPGQFPGSRQSIHLGVLAAVFLMPPFPHHLPVPDEDAPHHGVGMRSPPSSSTEEDGMLQNLSVRGARGSGQETLQPRQPQKVTRRARDPNKDDAAGSKSPATRPGSLAPKPCARPPSSDSWRMR